MRLRAQGHAPSGGFGETEPSARNPGHRHPERDATHGTGPRRGEHDAQGLGTGSGRMFHVKHSRRPSAESPDRKAQARRRGAPAQGLAPRARGHAGSEAKDARSGNPETQGTREAGTGVVTRGTGVGGRRGLGRAMRVGARGNMAGVSHETPAGSGCAACRWGRAQNRHFFREKGRLCMIAACLRGVRGPKSRTFSQLAFSDA